jgi:hypothetical protein
MIFVLGFLTGVAVLMLVALYLAAKDAKPEHQAKQQSGFTATSVSTNGNAAYSLEDELRILRNGQTQITRH